MTIPATRSADEICLLRLPEVLAIYRVSRSTLLLQISRGLFPRPIKLGLKCNAWIDHEVLAIKKGHVAGLGESDIAALVRTLHESRAARANHLTEASVA